MESVLQDGRLADWWARVSEGDYDEYAEKAAEYGSIDLDVIGHALRRLLPQDLPPGANKELGVLFYLLGKVARAISAYAAGGEPSDDTWHDIVVYGMMSRMFRAEREIHMEVGDNMTSVHVDSILSDVE